MAGLSYNSNNMTEQVKPSASGVTPVRKRRWWLWGLIVAGALVLMVVSLVAAWLLYMGHLLKVYTENAPRALPHIENPQAASQAFVGRVMMYHDALARGDNPAPLKITGDDLSAFMNALPPFKDKVWLQITNNQLQGLFSIPLDRNKRLKGKYLNGIVQFQLLFEDGYAVLKPKEVRIHDKPVPGWLMKRLQGQNVLEQVYKNTSAMEFMQYVQTITITNNAVLVRPLPPQ